MTVHSKTNRHRKEVTTLYKLLRATGFFAVLTLGFAVLQALTGWMGFTVPGVACLLVVAFLGTLTLGVVVAKLLGALKARHNRAIEYLRRVDN